MYVAVWEGVLKKGRGWEVWERVRKGKRGSKKERERVRRGRKEEEKRRGEGEREKRRERQQGRE